MDTLVLNSAYQPVSRVSWKKAITLYYNNKVEIVEEYVNEWIRSPSIKIKMPAVIRLVKNFFFQRPRQKFSKNGIFVRDNGECQYCGVKVKGKNLTLDHIIPRSKGGIRTWVNIVLACIKCNQKKKDLTPKEAGMKLRNKPVKPSEWADCIPEIWKNWV